MRVSPTLVARVSIALLLATAFGLRVWGADFGLPGHVYHPDEPAVVERAAAILRSGDFNPKWFHYPSGYIYTQTAAYIVYFLLGAVRGNFAFVPMDTLPQFYLIGRLATAAFGTMTVLVAYLIGQKIHRTRLGLIAAILATFSYLSIVQAHYATADVPASFWVALCTLLSILVLQRGQFVWYVLAGLAAGLAAGTKYNAGLVVMLIPLAHIMRTKWGEWGWLDRRIAIGLLAAAGGFILSTPYSVLDLPTFLNGLGFELSHYNTYQPGYTGGSGIWYLQAVLTSADALLALTYLGGALWAIIRPTKPRVLLVAFPVLYFLGLARTAVHFERNLLPLIPACSILAALFLDALAVRLASLMRQSQPIVLLAGTGVVALLPFVAGLCFDWSITRLDIRPVAGEWVSQNVSEEAKVAIEHYSIPFPRERYEVRDVLRFWDYPATWYSEQGFDYIVASNAVWIDIPEQSERYANERRIFLDLQEQYKLTKEFAPSGIPPIVVMGYPTIREYHFPHVWIFRVAK